VVSTDTGQRTERLRRGFMQEQQARWTSRIKRWDASRAGETDHRQHYRRRPIARTSLVLDWRREAMLMAQRHPTFFDGIISGAPAMRTALLGNGDEWVATMLNTAAPKDARARSIPAGAVRTRRRRRSSTGAERRAMPAMD
jgi:feruloyl esterase